MWQNPCCPPHLLVQALLLGAAVLLPFAVWLEQAAISPLLWILALTTLFHVLMIWGEVSLTHPTAHARLAFGKWSAQDTRAISGIGTALSFAGGLIPALALLGVVNISLASPPRRWL